MTLVRQISVAVLIAMIGLGAWRGWVSSNARHDAPTAGSEAVRSVSGLASSASEPAALPVAGAGQAHPIERVQATAAAAPPADLRAVLTDLFGRQAVQTLLQTDDFPRRLVATVDNLGRERAPAGLWPVVPAPGAFAVSSPRTDGPADELAIDADNALRYIPFVLMVESVDLRRVAALYAQAYPVFQQAYEDLGYPGRYFNDRLVEVIDLLLATPDLSGPVRVHLPAIHGPIRPERPWVLYEFDDPALEGLSAGQKMLLRMGPVNERRLKTRLIEFRRLVASEGVPR
ncbi:DUF3014 domain-containing protein [Ideonella sp. A 288]|uniref:DUF3014 domain-containing protein n=1 Tax=Ideonella sp. A 288 TaxID=1962181 RepID=UPI001F3DDAF0|nr:DUF3014 domain-containing protein [Ideonella sp. A 288]